MNERHRRLFWHLFPPFMVAFVLAFGVAALSVTFSFESFYRLRTRATLESTARLAAAYVMRVDPALGLDDVDRACKDLGTRSHCRITVILRDGTVHGDSLANPRQMDNHGDRPEIMAAIRDGVGEETRFSDTMRRKMMYVAVAIVVDGHTPAVVRASLAVDDIDRAAEALRVRLALVALTVLAVLVALGAVLSMRLSRPLEAMESAARAYAAGDFSHKLPTAGIVELDLVATTMNRMARDISERIRTITNQRDEEDVVLGCMMESVLAVDMEKRLLKMNGAAERLFGVDAVRVRGTGIAEVVRTADLLDIIDRTLAGGQPVEGDVYMPNRDRSLQAHGTALHDAAGTRLGAVVVLNDVTRLRKLEAMRRDFVANVSHELKTPITSIRGFADTLLDGHEHTREDTRRFLEIIARQAERVQSLIEDLLILSDIENGRGGGSIELTSVRPRRLLDNIVNACRPKASARGIVLEVSCAPELQVSANAQLLELAVTNLIDNAVKYANPDSVVRVQAERVGTDVAFRVADEGPGIAAKHLARVFERFYRVDKSRSRKLGGTGLGLAIVKNIALAHGGRVDVESDVRTGSVFSIYLPANGG